MKARVHLVYPGTEYTAGPEVDMWWYDGGEMPPDDLRAQVGTRMPEQGSLVVGTDGLLVLPHWRRGVRPAGRRRWRRSRSPSCRRAITTASSSTPCWPAASDACSAGFDYSGPLTESVLIGNVAAHYPGETLTFDAAGRSVSGQARGNQHLTRTYRKGWRIKT